MTQSINAESSLLGEGIVVKPATNKRDLYCRVLESVGVRVRALSSAADCQQTMAEASNARDRDTLVIVACLREAFEAEQAVLDQLSRQTLAPPIVLSLPEEPARADVRALAYSVWAVLPPTASTDQLQAVFREAVFEGRRRADDRRSVADFRDRVLALSIDEQYVLRAICQGKLNKQIASEAGVSIRTVEQRRRRVFTKMDVDSVAPLAVRLGMALAMERIDRPDTGPRPPVLSTLASGLINATNPAGAPPSSFA